MSDTEQPAGEHALVRALGVRGLAATTFNIMIGGGIFVLPAVAAAAMGARAPLAYVVCAVAMGLVVICFAEAGSRVSLTGGPYAYVRVALGPFAGFLSGVLIWAVALFAISAVASAMVASAAVLWPALARPAIRAVTLAVVIGSVAAVNVRGVRGGARLVELLTVAKLAPLILFVVAGALVAPAVVSAQPQPSGDLGRTVVILVFAFAGVESALVPSGEVEDPARTVPRAVGLAMLTVTALYIAIQLVAQRLLGVPALAANTAAPLAAAAQRIAGPAGAALIAGCAVVSMFGNVSGMTLATPRALYAMGRDGFLPFVSHLVARIHPRYRTPYVAIVAQSVLVYALAVSSQFAALAVLANVAVLTLYLLCCAATIVLRHRDVRAGGIPFRVPAGAWVPFAAIAVIVWILSHATRRELLVVGCVVAASSVFYAVTAPRRRLAARVATP